MATPSGTGIDLREQWREAYLGLALVVAVTGLTLGYLRIIEFLQVFLVVTGMVVLFLALMAVFGAPDSPPGRSPNDSD